MKWIQNLLAFFMSSPLTFWSLAHANDQALSCAMKNCTNHGPSIVAAKISACEVMVASSKCQSLGPDVKLRDCKSEAFCPNSLDQSYIVGCLIGVGSSALNTMAGVVTVPITLFKHAIVQAEFEAKYRNPSLYQACTAAEEAMAKAPKADLDCEQNFWHAACPRTLVRNCKNSLLEEFPDIKKILRTKSSEREV